MTDFDKEKAMMAFAKKAADVLDKHQVEPVVDASVIVNGQEIKNTFPKSLREDLQNDKHLEKFFGFLD